jgi:diguanylate cyclase (GGDEF)-like protein
MDYPLSKRCALDANAIGNRLRLLELDQAGMEAEGQELQDNVIAPNLGDIIDRFYGSLAGIDEFSRIVEDPSMVARVRASQEHYLLGLGINFRTREYFEERLRIGAVHQRVGVPHSLYQCTYQWLQGLIIDHIPQAIRDDEAAFKAMLQFILKITALDMSLAAESYCSARVSGLKQSLASERDRSDRLSKLAVTDWLTNLHNHSYSRRCLEAALGQARTEGSPLCVVMADLDHFKEINDAYGHLVGDEVLQIAAGRMISAARTGDEICRYGGEEFLFILQNTDIAGGKEVAERVRARINGDAVHSGDKQIELTLSLGLAQASADDTVNSLIERADRALYAAKSAGRDCVRLG